MREAASAVDEKDERLRVNTKNTNTASFKNVRVVVVVPAPVLYKLRTGSTWRRQAGVCGGRRLNWARYGGNNYATSVGQISLCHLGHS